MSNPVIRYTTDTHVGHRLVARSRGFVVSNGETEYHRGQWVPKADTKAHDDFLADYWDSTVKENDVTIVGGDISINGNQYALDWHAARPGIKVLVAGNHDKVHPRNRDAHKHFAAWSKVFTGGIFTFMRGRLAGKEFLISHYPYLGTGQEGHELLEARDPQYRLPDMGVPLLHGHTHGKERDHISDKGTPQLHIGLDAWDMKFVDQETVMSWLSEQ